MNLKAATMIFSWLNIYKVEAFYAKFRRDHRMSDKITESLPTEIGYFNALHIKGTAYSTNEHLGNGTPRHKFVMAHIPFLIIYLLFVD